MPLATVPRNLPVRAEVTAGSEDFAQSLNLNTPAEPPKSPVKLGPWQLEAVIADGQWSRVCRASRAGREGTAKYAIKMLREGNRIDSHANLGETRLRLLRNEATVGRCVMHPHLSPIVAAHVHEPPYYTVMPLLVGSNGAAAIQARGRFQTPHALWIARQVAEGLEALHTLGYVHGDVRPANIFVGSDGHATLIDLGCARRAHADTFLDDEPLMGSINSFAPELHLGQAATPRSDLYSLGLAMFQMLTGRLPWRGNDVGLIAAWKTSSQSADLREFAPGVPAAVARFVRSLMSVDPLRRPASAREVAAELVRLEIATLNQRLPK
jgi:eukaryotic-like serine/threonine-protein kinase